MSDGSWALSRPNTYVETISSLIDILHDAGNQNNFVLRRTADGSLIEYPSGDLTAAEARAAVLIAAGKVS